MNIKYKKFRKSCVFKKNTNKTKKQYGGSNPVISNSPNINIDSELANALQNKDITIKDENLKQLVIKYTFLNAIISRTKPYDSNNYDIFTFYIPDEYYNKKEYLTLLTNILTQNKFAISSDYTRIANHFNYINRKIIKNAINDNSLNNNIHLGKNEDIAKVINNNTIGIIIYFNIRK
jgi:hypothetical protein